MAYNIIILNASLFLANKLQLLIVLKQSKTFSRFVVSIFQFSNKSRVFLFSRNLNLKVFFKLTHLFSFSCIDIRFLQRLYCGRTIWQKYEEINHSCIWDTPVRCYACAVCCDIATEILFILYFLMLLPHKYMNRMRMHKWTRTTW